MAQAGDIGRRRVRLLGGDHIGQPLGLIDRMAEQLGQREAGGCGAQGAGHGQRYAARVLSDRLRDDAAQDPRHGPHIDRRHVAQARRMTVRRASLRALRIGHCKIRMAVMLGSVRSSPWRGKST